jgi:hypothetical protein
MKNKYLLFILFGVLFILLGLYREYLFVNINNLMYLKYYGHSTLPVPDELSFLNSLSYKTIYYIKYPFTILSFLSFYGLSYWCLKSLTKDKNLLKWLMYSYLVLLLLSLSSMVMGYVIKMRLQDDEYTFSRWLMGIAQSPLVLLFILASSKLNDKLK